MEPRPFEDSRKKRRRLDAYQRAKEGTDRTCADCGTAHGYREEQDDGRWYIAHVVVIHLDGDLDNLKPDNLKPLCGPCTAKQPRPPHASAPDGKARAAGE